jgi:multiple sugar transport system ATP-binding protein
MNLLTATLTEGGAPLAGAVIPLSPRIRAAAARDRLTELVIGIRPEHLHLTDGAGTSSGTDGSGLTSVVLPAEVLLVEELGADALLHVRLTENTGPVVSGSATDGSATGDSVADDPVIRGHSAAGGNVVARTEGRKPPAPGQRVAFRVQPDDVFAFHPVTGARLVG